MAKRKYARMNEEGKGSECTRNSCKWQGQDEDKDKKEISYCETQLVCPKCGNSQFYVLLYAPKTL